MFVIQKILNMVLIYFLKMMALIKLENIHANKIYMWKFKKNYAVVLLIRSKKLYKQIQNEWHTWLEATV